MIDSCLREYFGHVNRSNAVRWCISWANGLLAPRKIPNAPIINAMTGVTKRALDGLMDDPVCIASGRSPVGKKWKWKLDWVFDCHIYFNFLSFWVEI